MYFGEHGGLAAIRLGKHISPVSNCLATQQDSLPTPAGYSRGKTMAVQDNIGH